MSTFRLRHTRNYIIVVSLYSGQRPKTIGWRICLVFLRLGNGPYGSITRTLIFNQNFIFTPHVIMVNGGRWLRLYQ